MRLRRIKNVSEKISSYNKIVCFEPTKNKGKWHQVFSNDNPLYLEIGMGKGKFIIENAQKNPNINYIGCELSESIIYKAARKVALEQLDNLLLINLDAKNLLDVFEKGEVDHLYLNFSDPWPKKKHEKRRLTSDSYLETYLEILKKPALIEFKTDNRALFEYSLKKLSEFQFRILEVSLNLHGSEIEEIITTEYEEKFKSLGKIIYYIKVGK